VRGAGIAYASSISDLDPTDFFVHGVPAHRSPKPFDIRQLRHTDSSPTGYWSISLSSYQEMPEQLDEAHEAPHREPPRWSMEVVLLCHVTPPHDTLRETVDEVCGRDCAIRSEGGRRVITVEGDAGDSVAAVEALQRKAQRLVERLSSFDCSIEMTGRLEDRQAPGEPDQAGSLAE
jgi:hypothetical protein